jgi:hypothetical protein
LCNSNNTFDKNNKIVDQNNSNNDYNIHNELKLNNNHFPRPLVMVFHQADSVGQTPISLEELFLPCF